MTDVRGVAHAGFKVQVRVGNADGGNSSVAVIDNEEAGVRLLRYGDSILGGQFLSQEWQELSPFTAFVTMGILATRVAANQGGNRSQAAMLQLGLGVGSVPQFAKMRGAYGIVDAVENSTVVAKLACEQFSYNAGRIFFADAHEFIQRHRSGLMEARQPGQFQDREFLHTVKGGAELSQRDEIEFGARGTQEATTFEGTQLEFTALDPNEGCSVTTSLAPRRRYELIAQDLYMGWNPLHMLRKEVFRTFRREWLHPERGVYLVNFVSIFRGPRSAFFRAVVHTLQYEFAHVICFRDAPPSHEATLPANHMCLASQNASLIDMGPVLPARRAVPLSSLDLASIADYVTHWRIFPAVAACSEDDALHLNSEDLCSDPYVSATSSSSFSFAPDTCPSPSHSSVPHLFAAYAVPPNLRIGALNNQENPQMCPSPLLEPLLLHAQLSPSALSLYFGEALDFTHSAMRRQIHPMLPESLWA